MVISAAQQTLSDAQIKSQIDVLNKDFGGVNDDKIKVPSYFSSFFTDCRINFVLAKTDPTGKATNGIVRKQTSIQYFSFDDRVKSSANGGDDSWDANQYLNIWVWNMQEEYWDMQVYRAAQTKMVVINSMVFAQLIPSPF